MSTSSVQVVGRRSRARLRRSATQIVQRVAARTRDYASLAAQVDAAVQHVVVIAGPRTPVPVNAIARAFPTAAIDLLVLGGSAGPATRRLPASITVTRCPDNPARAAALARMPPPQLVVDLGRNASAQLERLKALFLFVDAGGSWVIERPARPRRAPAGARAELVALAEATGPRATQWHAPDLIASCTGVRFAGPFTIIGKRYRHRVKVRDKTANALLAARSDTAWGEVVTARPARQFAPRAEVTVHGDRGEWYGQHQIDAVVDMIHVPELFLRRYNGAECGFEQRIAQDNLWLPDTFRHPLEVNLRHRRLRRATPWLARNGEGPDVASRHIDGPLFYFDTEYAGHFGHVLSEVVSRYWGWVEARRIDPHVRPLMSVSRYTREPLAPFQAKIFEALGIPVDRIEFVSQGEVVAVDSIYAATPMFSMPFYADPNVLEAWEIIRDSLRRPGATTPRRLFVGRPSKPTRTCRNSDQVQAFFAELGFEAFRPEQHDFADQVTAFANAEIIAGYAGSNMFGSMFGRDQLVFPITADTFNANNEFLISAVTGGRLYYVIGDAEHKHPAGRWTWQAYQSNFDVDVDRLGPGIRAVVEQYA